MIINIYILNILLWYLNQKEMNPFKKLNIILIIFALKDS